jgi:hypothetical protein
VEDTLVTANKREVVVTGTKVNVVAEPSLLRDETWTVVPSLNVSFPAVT